MNKMSPLPPHPRRIHHPANGNSHQARQSKPLVLGGLRKDDGRRSTSELKDIDDRVLDAGEARSLVGRNKGLRQLLGGEIEDPHAKPGRCQEAKEDEAGCERWRRYMIMMLDGGGVWRHGPDGEEYRDLGHSLVKADDDNRTDERDE
jgi:hypothetical protein